MKCSKIANCCNTQNVGGNLKDSINEELYTMKKFIVTLLFTGILGQIIFAQNNGDGVNLSSVDYFFKITKELNSGLEPSEDEWKTLFETSGYKISVTSDWSENVIRDMAIFAFVPGYQHHRDSILKISIVDNMDDYSKVFSKLTLINFMDMKKNLAELENFRNSYDFNTLKEASKERLKSFLRNPVDSLVVFPSVNLLCQEADAQSKSKGIVMDFNLFFKQVPTNENVDFLAHEMFHTYRRHFINEKFVKSNNLMKQIDILENEGIANMIDKTLNSQIQKLIILGYPQSIVDLYDSTYKNTPTKLQAMDSITCSFIRKEISEEEFDKRFKGFCILGGHPNSLYMTDIIKKAGLKDELITNFYRPVHFIKIYNRAANKEGTFVFSNEFVHYLEELELKYAD
ncbi:MAG TPA: hypothetical protein PK218_06950 [Flavobacterium sp.]|nr:hypothetical protein [Flavobacterium sp.]